MIKRKGEQIFEHGSGRKHLQEVPENHEVHRQRYGCSVNSGKECTKQKRVERTQTFNPAEGNLTKVNVMILKLNCKRYTEEGLCQTQYKLASEED